MVVFTTNALPFEWQIPGYQWGLIIPLSLVVGCHILLPVRYLFLIFFLLRNSRPHLALVTPHVHGGVLRPRTCRDVVLFLCLFLFLFIFPALMSRRVVADGFADRPQPLAHDFLILNAQPTCALVHGPAFLFPTLQAG